jgi:hypothetical protein
LVVSVPVPSPWSTATSHAAHEAQCTAFHAPYRMWRRNRLVSMTTINASNDSAPRLSHSVRYGERNGNTASSHPIGT